MEMLSAPSAATGGGGGGSQTSAHTHTHLSFLNSRAICGVASVSCTVVDLGP